MAPNCSPVSYLTRQTCPVFSFLQRDKKRDSVASKDYAHPNSVALLFSRNARTSFFFSLLGVYAVFWAIIGSACQWTSLFRAITFDAFSVVQSSFIPTFHAVYDEYDASHNVQAQFFKRFVQTHEQRTRKTPALGYVTVLSPTDTKKQHQD